VILPELDKYHTLFRETFMNKNRTFLANGLFVAAAMFATASHAQAGFIMTIQQVGSDVVETGSGTINLSALTDGGSATSSATNGGSVWPSCSCTQRSRCRSDRKP
jgi:hypothetical protein